MGETSLENFIPRRPFLVELPTKLAVAKENDLLVQKVNGETLTSESREIHNSLVALLVFAENFNFPFG